MRKAGAIMRMITTITAAAALAALGCATTRGPSAMATAVLQTPTGAAAGAARMEQGAAGVRVRIDVLGLAPGMHGVHVHAVGRCDGAGDTWFESAGGHFNPDDREHGLNNPRGPHAGDLPNITVAADGTGSLEVTTDRFTLDEGAPSVFDADGAALVVHAQADDLASDPAGNAGARIACGVLRPLT
jgi:Cu-Zn family superoxide dismutase